MKGWGKNWKLYWKKEEKMKWKKINGEINQILYERTERKWETDTVKHK